MKDIPLAIALIAIAAVALGVCVAVARSICREVNSIQDKETLKEIEKWREGR